MSFLDKNLIHQLLEQVDTALRPLGITVIPESVGFSYVPEQDATMLQLICMVRDSAEKTAREGVVSEAESQEFMKMMGERNQARLQEQFERYKEEAARMLRGEDPEPPEPDCPHENTHPDGFCLDCGKGLE